MIAGNKKTKKNKFCLIRLKVITWGSANQNCVKRTKKMCAGC